jgi:hypothetical protein
MAFWTQILRFLRRNCNRSHKSIAKVWVLMIMTRFLCICGHWRSPSLRRLFHIIICLIFNYCLNFRSIMSHTWWICLVREDFLPLSSRCGIKVARKPFLTDSKKLILNIFLCNFFVSSKLSLYLLKISELTLIYFSFNFLHLLGQASLYHRILNCNLLIVIQAVWVYFTIDKHSHLMHP